MNETKLPPLDVTQEDLEFGHKMKNQYAGVKGGECNPYHIADLRCRERQLTAALEREKALHEMVLLREEWWRSAEDKLAVLQVAARDILPLQGRLQAPCYAILGRQYIPLFKALRGLLEGK